LLDAADWDYGDDGEGNYDKGLLYFVCDDGRLRTSFAPTLDTRRWRSRNPPMQNLSKKRDGDYKAIFKALGLSAGGISEGAKLRSILTADPGNVLIEADYTGAELFMAALLSGDERMVEHTRRNALPESDPDFYDLHSSVAVLAFGLDCKPSKKELKDLGLGHLRDAAKAIIFGLMYGSGAASLMLRCHEVGAMVTIDQARAVIDTIFGLYPRLKAFFEEIKARVANERWLGLLGGGFRRFASVTNEKDLARQQRQGMNVPMQGGVASVVDRAIINLQRARRDLGDPNLFRFRLQIHDAVVVETKASNAEYVRDKLLPWAMVEANPVHPVKLDGTLSANRPPRFLAIESTVHERWCVPLSEDDCKRLGVPGSWAGH